MKTTTTKTTTTKTMTTKTKTMKTATTKTTTKTMTTKTTKRLHQRQRQRRRSKQTFPIHLMDQFIICIYCANIANISNPNLVRPPSLGFSNPSLIGGLFERTIRGGMTVIKIHIVDSFYRLLPFGSGRMSQCFTQR